MPSARIETTTAAAAALNAEAERIAAILRPHACIRSTSASFDALTDTGIYTATLVDGSFLRARLSSLSAVHGVVTLSRGASGPQFQNLLLHYREEAAGLRYLVAKALGRIEGMAGAVEALLAVPEEDVTPGRGAPTGLLQGAPAGQCDDERVLECLDVIRGFEYEGAWEKKEKGGVVVLGVGVHDLGLDEPKFVACGFEDGWKIVLRCHFRKDYLSFGEWEESEQVLLEAKVVDCNGAGVDSALLKGIEKVLQSSFREMAKFRAEMEIGWEEAFCLVHEREVEAVGDWHVPEMLGEGAQKKAERNNLCLLALRWVRREIYTCFSRCWHCRAPLSPPGDSFMISMRLCESALCHKEAGKACGSVCMPQRFASGRLEAEILRDPLAADLCISLCYATLFEEPQSLKGKLAAEVNKFRRLVDMQLATYAAPSGEGDDLSSRSRSSGGQDPPSEPLPIAVILDPTPPEMRFPRKRGVPCASLTYDAVDFLGRSKERALTRESYQVLRDVLFLIPRMDMLYAVCRSSGRLRDFLDDRHNLAYPVLEWILLTSSALKVNYASTEGVKVRMYSQTLPFSSTVSYPVASGRRTSGSWQARQLTHPYEFPRTCPFGNFSYQFYLKSDDTTTGTAAQAIDQQGSCFGYHGSALGRWWSILHNSLDFSETENGRALGDGIYVAGSFVLSDGYAKRVSLCAVWPGSLLRVNSIVGVVEVPPRAQIVSRRRRRGFIGPMNIVETAAMSVQSKVAARYLLCSSAVEEADIMHLFNRVADFISAGVRYSPLFVPESRDYPKLAYAYAEKASDRRDTSNPVYIAEARVATYSGFIGAGFTDRNTFCGSDGFQIPLI